MRVRTAVAVRVGLAAVVLATLAVDAYVHLDLAADYDAVESNLLSQGDLFRLESVVALLALVALAVRPRRYTALIAFVVLAGGFGAVMLYQYVNVGAVGPIPNMYEPAWYAEKTQSAWAEGIGAVAALALVVIFPGVRTPQPAT